MVRPMNVTMRCSDPLDLSPRNCSTIAPRSESHTTYRRKFTPEFKAQVGLERLSAAKSNAEWCCEHQIAPSVLADMSEADTACARSALPPEKNSDRSITKPW
jgi:transposase-like protein